MREKLMWAIWCGGFRGNKYYVSREEAQIAADARTALSGREWVVKPILVKEGF